MNKVIDIINLCEDENVEIIIDENDMDLINLCEDESVEIIIDEDAVNLREDDDDDFWDNVSVYSTESDIVEATCQRCRETFSGPVSSIPTCGHPLCSSCYHQVRHVEECVLCPLCGFLI